jgi:hypothetical protein
MKGQMMRSRAASRESESRPAAERQGNDDDNVTKEDLQELLKQRMELDPKGKEQLGKFEAMDGIMVKIEEARRKQAELTPAMESTRKRWKDRRKDVTNTTDSLQTHYSECMDDLAELEWASENLEEWASQLSEEERLKMGEEKNSENKSESKEGWEDDMEAEALKMWEAEQAREEKAEEKATACSANEDKGEHKSEHKSSTVKPTPPTSSAFDEAADGSSSSSSSRDAARKSGGRTVRTSHTMNRQGRHAPPTTSS